MKASKLASNLLAYPNAEVVVEADDEFGNGKIYDIIMTVADNKTFKLVFEEEK